MSAMIIPASRRGSEEDDPPALSNELLAFQNAMFISGDQSELPNELPNLNADWSQAADEPNFSYWSNFSAQDVNFQQAFGAFTPVRSQSTMAAPRQEESVFLDPEQIIAQHRARKRDTLPEAVPTDVSLTRVQRASSQAISSERTTARKQRNSGLSGRQNSSAALPSTSTAPYVVPSRERFMAPPPPPPSTPSIYTASSVSPASDYSQHYTSTPMVDFTAHSRRGSENSIYSGNLHSYPSSSDGNWPQRQPSSTGTWDSSPEITASESFSSYYSQPTSDEGLSRQTSATSAFSSGSTPYTVPEYEPISSTSLISTKPSLTPSVTAIKYTSSLPPNNLSTLLLNAFITASASPKTFQNFLVSRDPHRLSPTLSHSSVDWRLAGSLMSQSLSMHLIDEFFLSSCSEKKVFDSFREVHDQFRRNVDGLDAAGEVVAAAFCLIGARSSAHTALLGMKVDVTNPRDVTVDKAKEAVMRRQQVCEMLLEKVWELCQLKIASDNLEEGELESPEAVLRKIEALVIVSALYEKTRDSRRRTVLRLMIGTYQDLRHRKLPKELVNGTSMRTAAKCILMIDGLVACVLDLPLLIKKTDIDLYYNGEWLNTPSLQLDDISRMSKAGFEAEGATHGTIVKLEVPLLSWVVEIYRFFAEWSTACVFDHSQCAPLARFIWEAIRKGEAVTQDVQEAIDLKRVIQNPIGCEGDYCVETHIRNQIKNHRDLAELTMLVHRFLLKKKDELEGLGALDSLIDESEPKVRHSLRTMAVYSRFYLEGRDRHLLYFCALQLSILPQWTEIALRRVGGASEELSLEEIQWLKEGQRFSVFYTPKAETGFRKLDEAMSEVA